MLPIVVNVDDENDNAPTFSSPLSFSVLEKSKAGEEEEEGKSTRGIITFSSDDDDKLCGHV